MFFDLVQQDPVVSRVKLIAEPWDVGEGGYQVGNFPALWTEWNGKYRDTVRDFWRGEGSTIGEFASRLTGSSDLYEGNGRKPYASINFVTAHDGFTLHDLVSYNDKHNEANGEDNRDGESTNRSWNCGVEGPTDDLDVVALREQQKRNFLTTLLLSQGVPMIVAGDEMGRTQGGNNNAYCQDNAISWVDWGDVQENSILLEFARRLAALRMGAPDLSPAALLPGPPAARLRAASTTSSGCSPSSEVMSQEDWDNGWARSLGVFLNGAAIPDPDRARQQGAATTRSCCSSTPTTSRSTFTIPDAGVRGGVGDRRQHRSAAAPMRRRDRLEAARDGGGRGPLDPRAAAAVLDARPRIASRRPAGPRPPAPTGCS